MSNRTTPFKELVQERLGRSDLAEWVELRRADGDSWVTVAAALSQRTDLDISRETLRRWMARKDVAA